MEDKRLERLYDYTKWHLGIYLSAGGALTAAIGYLADKSKAPNLAPFVDRPVLLLLAVVFMFAAGACGGVVASSCTECTSYDELWNQKHGPAGRQMLKGRHWAGLEHLFFWCSVAFAVLAVLLSSPIRAWLSL